MYITEQSIITLASLIGAIITILTCVLKLHKFYLKQEKQDSDIKKLQQENCLICYGLSACLDGLQQLGANHTVTTAKDKLDKHLNMVAHEINEGR